MFAIELAGGSAVVGRIVSDEADDTVRYLGLEMHTPHGYLNLHICPRSAAALLAALSPLVSALRVPTGQQEAFPGIRARPPTPKNGSSEETPKAS